MASLQCPKCGIRHNYGTHCAFCGEMLESAPQTPSPQHAAPAPFSHVAEQAPNTSEIANPDVKGDNNYLAPELPQSGVMVQNKHPLRLVLIVLVSCLALASIIFALNYPHDNAQIVQLPPPAVPSTPVIEPAPVIQDNTVNKTEIERQRLEEKIKIEKQRLEERYNKNQLFTITHDSILNRVRDNISVLLTEEDLNKDNETLRQEIDYSLEINDLYSNSEDFIIAMDGDLNRSQKILKKLDYRNLYKAIYDKHQNSYSQPFNYQILTDWDENLTALLFSKGKELDPSLQDGRTTCSNNSFKHNKDILNASIEFTIHNLSRIEISLGWNDFRGKYNRFYDDFKVDPYLLLDDGKNEQIISPGSTKKNGRITIAKSGRALTNDVKNILASGGLIIVYGRFIPDPEYDRSYFVLSYREYSLNYDYSCPTLKQYKRNVLPTRPSNDFRPRDSQIDLPF